MSLAPHVIQRDATMQGNLGERLDWLLQPMPQHPHKFKVCLKRTVKKYFFGLMTSDSLSCGTHDPLPLNSLPNIHLQCLLPHVNDASPYYADQVSAIICTSCNNQLRVHRHHPVSWFQRPKELPKMHALVLWSNPGVRTRRVQ